MVGTTSTSIWISKVGQPTTNSWLKTRTVAIQCTHVEASLPAITTEIELHPHPIPKTNRRHMKHIPTLIITSDQNRIIPSYQIVNHETTVVLAREVLKILHDGRVLVVRYEMAPKF